MQVTSKSVFVKMMGNNKNMDRSKLLICGWGWCWRWGCGVIMVVKLILIKMHDYDYMIISWMKRYSS